ncbi:hypothetical protein ASF98_18660 [Arthrobacter sp. Leaf337]|uniref:hypothetical protein n=1 Tax=Arthrobacter sp. Leaf337 TaxID=1736342 RepID=UPI0006F2976E|nr:hypothetical protein [Arthrobacter sp. Leaf337]KQR80317.1 hypothetical protein ASF98_18660 [Arthrobacter sp. Leaf337]
MTLDIQLSLDLLGTASDLHSATYMHAPTGVIDTANQKITDLTNLLKLAAGGVSVAAVFVIAILKKFKVTGIILGIVAGGLFAWGVFSGIGWWEGQMKGELSASGPDQGIDLPLDTVSPGYLTVE